MVQKKPTRAELFQIWSMSVKIFHTIATRIFFRRCIIFQILLLECWLPSRFNIVKNRKFSWKISRNKNGHKKLANDEKISKQKQRFFKNCRLYFSVELINATFFLLIVFFCVLRLYQFECWELKKKQRNLKEG